MQNRQKFQMLMNVMCEVYHRDISDALLDIYWRVLAPYSDKQVEEACNTAVRTCKFFPKPAELIELMQGSLQERALIQADKVLDAVRRVGYYDTPSFDDPITAAVVGNWKHLCKTLAPEKEDFYRKSFVERYIAYSREGGRVAALPAPDTVAGELEAMCIGG